MGVTLNDRKATLHATVRCIIYAFVNIYDTRGESILLMGSVILNMTRSKF